MTSVLARESPFNAVFRLAPPNRRCWRFHPATLIVSTATGLRGSRGAAIRADATADDPPETSKPAPGGLLGALGLSPKALLLVALLALLVWLYFQNQGMALTASETATVVLALALAVAAARAVWGLLQRFLAPASGKPGETPK